MKSTAVPLFSRMFAWRDGQGPWGKPQAKRGAAPQEPKTVGAGRARNGNTTPSQPELEEMVNQMREKFGAFMGGNGSDRGGGTGNGFGLPGGFQPEWALVGLAGLWLMSGFFIVAPEEQGVVTRFGAYQRTVDPGLNFHAPWPLERVQKLPVQRVNQLAIGFRSGEGGTLDVPAESLMLTKDQNIVDLDFTVQWRIVNPSAFLFNLANPERTVADVAESVMRETIGRHTIDDALTSNKVKITTEARDLLQAVLNRYGAGVRVVGLQLQQVNPPAEVIDAFRDVQAASADAEKLKNEAMGYANQIVPLARGQAAKLLQEAEAYKTARVAQAEGDAARFNAQVEAYQANPAVTKQRLYLETMEEVLPGLPKVVTTGRGTQSVLPYLPLDRLPKASGGNQGGAQ
ncbi:MAG: FtsH protease activity modulator HflK [Alphaproteobacteria bacterium]|nr:FtsH protease activity modulator HflK [Alphaproteobacteria bacterium]